MRFIAITFLSFILLTSKIYAQQDESNLEKAGSFLKDSQVNHRLFLDSASQVLQYRQQIVSDSLFNIYITLANPLRYNQLTDSLFKSYLYKDHNLGNIPPVSKNTLKGGSSRQTRDQWVIFVIIGLLLYAAILNRTIGKNFEILWQSFDNKRMQSQVSSRGNSIIDSWAFIGFFLLFGLTLGLFLYQLSQYYHVYYSVRGVKLFILLSLIILILFTIKFLVIKFIGFVFDINKLVNEYLSVLYLTYINIAFVFLPLIICFSMLTNQLIPYILAIALILSIIIFIWQYLRNSVNIISHILFHKFYLFMYVCALEICPILILIKVLNI